MISTFSGAVTSCALDPSVCNRIPRRKSAARNSRHARTSERTSPVTRDNVATLTGSAATSSTLSIADSAWSDGGGPLLINRRSLDHEITEEVLLACNRPATSYQLQYREKMGDGRNAARPAQQPA